VVILGVLTTIVHLTSQQIKGLERLGEGKFYRNDYLQKCGQINLDIGHPLCNNSGVTLMKGIEATPYHSQLMALLALLLRA
jgi:hypothetical protein